MTRSEIKARVFFIVLPVVLVGTLGLVVYSGIRDTEHEEQTRKNFHTVERRIDQNDFPTYEELIAIMGKPDKIESQPGHDEGNNLDPLKQGETDLFWRSGPGREGVEGYVGVRTDTHGKAKLIIGETAYLRLTR